MYNPPRQLRDSAELDPVLKLPFQAKDCQLRHQRPLEPTLTLTSIEVELKTWREAANQLNNTHASSLAESEERHLEEREALERDKAAP